ncbi:hypothetical protein [Corynebacterium frankenforstense]
MSADHVVDIELTLAVTARAGLAAALAAVADRFGAGEGEPGDAADDETASPVAAGLSAAFDQLTRVPEAVRTACTASRSRGGGLRSKLTGKQARWLQ